MASIYWYTTQVQQTQVVRERRFLRATARNADHKNAPAVIDRVLGASPGAKVTKPTPILATPEQGAKGALNAVGHNDVYTTAHWKHAFMMWVMGNST